MSEHDAVQGTPPEANELLVVALAGARAAAAVVGAAAHNVAVLEWTEKGVADFVTDVDRSAEAAAANTIVSALPEARILGEELTPDGTDARNNQHDAVIFIIDPLDGTTNFLHGYPEYAVSIGVQWRGKLLAAVILNVATGETFTAVSGGGAFRDGSPIQVSATSRPSRALLGTGFPFKHRALIPSYLEQLDTMLRSTAGVRRAGSAALDLADVACGRFDGFWELMLAPWDIAGGLLLVREAGGIVTDLDGAAAAATHTSVVAANPELHPWLLATLNHPGVMASSDEVVPAQLHRANADNRQNTGAVDESR